MVSTGVTEQPHKLLLHYVHVAKVVLFSYGTALQRWAAASVTLPASPEVALP